MTCPNTDLVSQTCSDGMLFPHNENTWAFVQCASGKLPRSCICPLIYTLQNKPDLQESDGLYKRWVGCAPSPNPCLLLILRNNRGCSHLPKTPTPEKEGGKAASWLNKAETPVFQKHTDVDRQALLQVHLPSGLVVWGGDQFGWETHTTEKASFGPHYSHFLATLLTFLCLSPSTFLLLEGLKGRSISGNIFPPSLLILPFGLSWKDKWKEKQCHTQR